MTMMRHAEKRRRGDRRTLEEPWAAAAHSDETLAVSEPVTFHTRMRSRGILLRENDHG
jgi:hypothetical protein